jgi:hypothetical protein
MTCYQCGGSPVGSCTSCGRFFCSYHRKEWLGRVLCADCSETARKRQVVASVMLGILVLVTAAFFTTLVWWHNRLFPRRRG